MTDGTVTDRRFTVMGEEVPVDLREWSPLHRRMGSLVVIGAASLLVLLGIVVYLAAPSASWMLTLLIALMVLVVLFEAAVVATGVAEEREAADATAAGAATVDPATQREPAPSPEPEQGPEPAHDTEIQVLTLKCSECGTIFDLEDDGTRPLTHMCPGCGAEGVLQEEDLPAAAPAASSGAQEPASEWAERDEEGTDDAVAPVEPAGQAASTEGEAEGEAGDEWDLGWEDDEEQAGDADEAPEEPADAPPKRVKLRCSGCETVFALEDTGERPLRHRCPGCGKKGQLR